MGQYVATGGMCVESRGQLADKGSLTWRGGLFQGPSVYRSLQSEPVITNDLLHDVKQPLAHPGWDGWLRLETSGGRRARMWGRADEGGWLQETAEAEGLVKVLKRAPK